MKSCNKIKCSLEIIQPNSSDKNRIYSFLIKVDNQYHTPLSQRVDLHSYAKKLAINAYNFFLMEASVDIAHAAIYHNKPKSVVFLSNIAILEKYAGDGLGSLLLEKIEEFSIANNVKTISLEADADSKKLKGFYVGKGFELIKSDQNISFFTKQLTY